MNLMTKRINPSLTRSSKRFSFNSYWMANKMLTTLTFWNLLILHSLFSLILKGLDYTLVDGYVQKHSSGFKFDCLIKKNEILSLGNRPKTPNKSVVTLFPELDNWPKFLNSYNCFSPGIYFTTSFQLEIFKKHHRSLVSRLGIKSFPDSPEFLANYIAYQITTSKQNKNPDFQKGFTFGLYSTAKIFLSTLRLTKNSPLGIRIVCNGRWMKTSTGRSKKISLSIGSIHTKNMNSILYGGTASRTTRFGKFTINILLDFRRTSF